jgi:hypothetical protein
LFQLAAVEATRTVNRHSSTACSIAASCPEAEQHDRKSRNDERDERFHGAPEGV